MKALIKSFLSVRSGLLVILALSFITYFAIELYLIDIPEFIQGGYKIGQFTLRLCQAYISAFIFYFIVVHLKSEKDKKNINEYVGHKVFGIITCAHLFIQPFLQKNDKKANFKYMDKRELGELLRSINRREAEAPYIIGDRTGTWLEWYEYLKDGTLHNLKEIFVRLPYLDSELIKKLTRIENSLFIYQWELLYLLEHDKTFSMYEFQIFAYMNLIKDLEDYANKHFKEYQYMTSEFVGSRGYFKTY